MTGAADRRGYGPRTSLDRVHGALEQQGFRPNKQSHDFKALCPCHDEKSGSLHVTWRSQPQGGRVLLKCFGCDASAEDIAVALGLTVADLYDEPLPEQPRVGRSPRQRAQGKARPTAGRLPARLTGSGRSATPDEPETHTWVDVETYAYADGDAVLVQQVVRRVCSSCPVPHKAFHQQFVGASGRTVERKPPGFVPVLYRLPEVRAAVAAGEPVYLVEGEKDVHTAERLGVVGTTNPGGGGVFPDAMADELAGADVRVVLDRDDTGWARGVRLHEQLVTRGARVRLLLPAVTTAKTDLTDHVEAGRPLGELVEVRVDEVRAWAALSAAAKALRLVRECHAEARARLQLAEAAATPTQAEVERGHARRWADAAATRWEALADEAGGVVRLAEAAGSSWAAEAADLARSALRIGSTVAREVHELTGVEPPGELRPENAAALDASRSPAALLTAATAPLAPADRPVRKLLPGQTRYEVVDGALYEMRRVKTGKRTDPDGSEGEVWEDKPKLVLNLAPQIVEVLYPAPEEEAEQAPTRGRESRAGMAKVRDAQMPTHVTFRYVHPVTGQVELVRVEHDAALDSSWLATLPVPALSYDSSRSGRSRVWDAIRQTSAEAQSTVLYRATGWQELPEHGWGWVHAGGAITAKGNVAIPVRLTGTLARFDLPDPLTDAARLREAFLTHSLGMLDRLPERIGAVLVGHMFRAAVTANGFSPVLVGVPGTYKTALAALGMHHYGEAWDRDRPATSMSGNGDTLNALRWKLHKGKDGVTFCDDVAPTKDFVAAQKLLEEVGRMVHGKEGRTRLQRDGQDANSATPPRGSALFTSEVYPRPGSGEERLVTIPLSKGQIERADVVALDEDASRHGRAVVMSSFLSWLAADLPLQRDVILRQHAETYTQRLLQRGRDNRKADAYGHLWAGWKLLSSFLVDVEALTSDERDQLLERVDSALDAALTAAVDPDVPNSAGGRVREMIAWAFSAGLAHVLDAATGECPTWPLAARLGHRAVKPVGGSGYSSGWTAGGAPERTEPRGAFAGYVVTAPRVGGAPREVLMDRLALEQIIKAAAGQLSDAPQMDGRTAMRSLYDAGVLLAELDASGDPVRYAKWRTVECLSSSDHKARQRMVVLDLDKLFGNDPDDPYGLLEATAPPSPIAPVQPSPDTSSPAGSGALPTPPDAPPTPPAPYGPPNGGQSSSLDDPVVEQTTRAWTRSDGATCQPHHNPDPEACYGCQQPTDLLFDSEPWHAPCWVDSDPCGAPAGEEEYAFLVDEPAAAAASNVRPSRPAEPTSDTSPPAAAAGTRPPPGATATQPPAAAVQPASADQQPSAGTTSASAPRSSSARRPAVAGGPQIAVAVVDVDRLVLGDGSTHPLPEPLTHLGHLAEIAERFGLRSTAVRGHVEPGTVVVTSALAARLGLPVEQLPVDPTLRVEAWQEHTEGHPVLTEALQDGWSTGATNSTALRGWVRLQHADRKLTVRVAFAPVLHGELVDDDPTPMQIARRLQLVADHLGYPWRVNASATGLDLLTGLRWRDRDKLFTPVPPVPPAKLFLEPDLSWSRVPYSEEAQRPYLHVYDRGGSYAAGLAGLEVGIGAPVHHRDGVSFDKRIPGYYRVRLVEQGDLRMPHPLYVTAGARRGDDTAWVTAPTIELAASLDYPIEVVEAYTWPEHGRVFTSWYEVLRDARTALDVDDVDAQAARNMVKTVYVQTIGMMGSHELHGGKRGYAPDRRHAIVAKSRSNLLRRVHQIGTSTGAWPVAISNDSVAYTCDESDPVLAWPGNPEHFGRGLGQYKPERSGLLTPHLPHLTGHGWKGKPTLTKVADWDPGAAAEL